MRKNEEMLNMSDGERIHLTVFAPECSCRPIVLYGHSMGGGTFLKPLF